MRAAERCSPPAWAPELRAPTRASPKNCPEACKALMRQADPRFSEQKLCHRTPRQTAAFHALTPASLELLPSGGRGPKRNESNGAMSVLRHHSHRVQL